MQPVLVAEADEVTRDTLAELLARSGFKVIALEQAWGIFLLPDTCDVPSLLVTDINFGPGIDGFKLAAAARCRWPELPVIGIGGQLARYQLLHAGPCDWFHMAPFGPAQFVADVRALVGGREEPGKHDRPSPARATNRSLRRQVVR